VNFGLTLLMETHDPARFTHATLFVPPPVTQSVEFAPSITSTE
jgi:hypothetical protein